MMTSRPGFEDLARRALHTFWQAFLGAVAIAYAASGLNVSQVVDEDSAKKFALALAGAVLAAAASAAKTTALALFTPQTLGHNGSTGTGPLPDLTAAAEPASTVHHPLPGARATAGRHEAPETATGS